METLSRIANELLGRAETLARTSGSGYVDRHRCSKSRDPESPSLPNNLKYCLTSEFLEDSLWYD